MPAVYRYLLVFDPVYLPGEPMKSLIITRKLALPMCFRFPMGLLNPWSMLMLIKLSLAVVGALMVLPPNACAAKNSASRCVDVSLRKNAVIARDGKWIKLTPEQWQFLRGVYALNSETPPGLPYGDKAVLAQVGNDAGGLVFFIDGKKACTPMRAPLALLALMDQVATAKINHEGTGL